jgi:hypothetical protein
MLFVPASSFGLAITSVKITGVVPNPIPCGGTANVTVEVGYHYNPYETLPQTGTIELWEFDPGIFDSDEKLSNGSHFTVGLSDQQIGTKTVVAQVSCTPPAPECTCDFFGPQGVDDEHGSHMLYAYSLDQGLESPIVNVECIKPDGTFGCLPQPYGKPSEALAASWTYWPLSPVANVQINISYDPTVVTATSASWDPAVSSLFASSSTSVSTPGIISFQAFNPTNVTFPSLSMHAQLQISSSAPFGPTPLVTHPSTAFRDQNGNSLVVGHANTNLIVTKPDAVPPSVNPGLLVWEPAAHRVRGTAGAVSDNELSTGAGYVRVRLLGDPYGGPVETAYFGVADVQLDGSFVMNNVNIDPLMGAVQIEAKDDAGNISSTSWTPGSASGVDVATNPDHLSLRLGPSPSQGGTDVSVLLPRAVPSLRVRVYDIRGRFVARLWDGAAGPGTLALHWDGSSNGRPVSSGVYRVEAEGQGFRAVKESIRLK